MMCCRLVESRSLVELTVEVFKHLSWHTSSSAVVERPRDASYPSVGSFNGVIHRAESFIIVT